MKLKFATPDLKLQKSIKNSNTNKETLDMVHSTPLSLFVIPNQSNSADQMRSQNMGRNIRHIRNKFHGTNHTQKKEIKANKSKPLNSSEGDLNKNTAPGTMQQVANTNKKPGNSSDNDNTSVKAEEAQSHDSNVPVTPPQTLTNDGNSASTQVDEKTNEREPGNENNNNENNNKENPVTKEVESEGARADAANKVVINIIDDYKNDTTNRGENTNSSIVSTNNSENLTDVFSIKEPENDSEKEIEEEDENGFTVVKITNIVITPSPPPSQKSSWSTSIYNIFAKKPIQTPPPSAPNSSLQINKTSS